MEKNRANLEKLWEETEFLLNKLKKYENLDKEINTLKKNYNKFLESYFDFEEIANNLFDGIDMIPIKDTYILSTN